MRMETPTGFPTGDSLSAFSTLHFLKNYNQIFLPSDNNLVQVYHNYPCGTSIGDLPKDSFSQSPTFPFFPLVGAFHPYSQFSLSNSPDLKSRQTFLPSSTIYGRRSRGEKKPIPDDQKDDRYYERRKRNNQAAKKSRDARKLREDQIALRAALLEHENAILRTQLLTLREEAESLRQIILSQKKPLGPFTKKETKEKILDREMKWEFDFEFHTPKVLNKIVEV